MFEAPELLRSKLRTVAENIKIFVLNITNRSTGRATARRLPLCYALKAEQI
jgi:hypothetical protein